MRALVFGIVLMTCAVLPAGAALELQLTTRLSEQLPYLRPDMRLEAVNVSPDPILFPNNAFRVRFFLEMEDGWGECRPLRNTLPAPLSEIDWKELGPGESIPFAIPASRCAEGEGTWFEWANQPGTHRVKVKITTFAHKIGVPEGAFDGVLESNVVEFRIKEPVGIDAEAIEWAKGSPMHVELLDEYPTSEYAAFFIHGYSARLDKADPAKVGSLIARGAYPGSASVPDRDGWRSLSSEDVARWQIEWGQRILREHPEFPFRDEIRTSVALAQMSLGNRTEARKTLNEIAKRGSTRAAVWVKAFLEVEGRE